MLFISLEETIKSQPSVSGQHIDDHWVECFSETTDFSTAELYKANPENFEGSYAYEGGGGCQWDPDCGSRALRSTRPNGRVDSGPALALTQLQACLNGFERKLPDCDGCSNSFPLEPQPAECQCTPSETLGVLFKQTFGRGTKEEIAAALNLTDFFIYQAMAVVTANFDTGNHNYVSAATACRSHLA